MKADRIILGIALLFVGIVWVLVNVGMLSAQAAFQLWRYWPLLLVLWGVSLILGRGGGLSGCLVGLLVFLIIAAAVFSFVPPFINSPSARLVESSFSVGEDEAITSVELNFTQHAGEFILKSKPPTSIGKQLVEVRVNSFTTPDSMRSNVNGSAILTVREAEMPVRWGGHGSRFDVSIREQLPAEINIRTGAGRAELDMSYLQVSRLNLTAGAGDISIVLGEGNGSVNVQSGAGNITVYIPERTGVRLRVNGGLVSVRSENARVSQRGNRYYESEKLEEKPAVIELNITAGAGMITLRPANSGRTI